MECAFYEEVDLLVIGAGASAGWLHPSEPSQGGPFFCEKTGMVGGTTSTFGGMTWVSGTALSRKAGVPDSAGGCGHVPASCHRLLRR